MGTGQTHRGSPETPVIFPAFPWLVDGNKYEAYLESAIAHLKAQECPEAEILPPFLTEPLDKPPSFEFANAIEQMIHVTPKLNEIIEEFLKSNATHLWFLNADAEVPSHALCKLLELDVDVISGLSPPHSSREKSTALIWKPAPSPEYEWSKPWYKMIWMKQAYGNIIGGTQVIATGHFCMLCKRRVFEQFSPNFEPLRFLYDYPQPDGSETEGSETRFWREAQELGFICLIHGGVVVGHLPDFPLEMLEEWLKIET